MAEKEGAGASGEGADHISVGNRTAQPQVVAPAPVSGEHSYKLKMDAAIRDLLLEFDCQPILFIGSGLPRRYFNSPNWLELLKILFESIPDQTKSFDYYKQKFDSDPIKIGTVISDIVFEWAWSGGRNAFPSEYFQSSADKDIFVKHLCCEYLKSITPKVSELEPGYLKEIAALSSVRPHAIITTNYDLLLENIFEGYEPITGQTILRYNTNSFGEIFHIHGDVTEAQSLVFTERDYRE